MKYEESWASAAAAMAGVVQAMDATLYSPSLSDAEARVRAQAMCERALEIYTEAESALLSSGGS